MELNNNDVVNIRKALSEGGEVWDNQCLDDFKSRFKSEYRNWSDEQCCYCKKNSYGEFKMVLDIEHILPKKRYAEFMFSPFNLSIACKRCNMNVKRDDISFLVNPFLSSEAEDSLKYKFIHPNFDDYYTHMSYECSIANKIKLIKYTVLNNSSKGEFTYNYFRLKELEIDSINKSQGIREVTEVSNLVGGVVVKEIEELIRKLQTK